MCILSSEKKEKEGKNEVTTFGKFLICEQKLSIHILSNAGSGISELVLCKKNCRHRYIGVTSGENDFEIKDC